jgi:hypothetical protein
MKVKMKRKMRVSQRTIRTRIRRNKLRSHRREILKSSKKIS